MTQKQILQRIYACGAVVILRLPDSKKIIQIAEAILKGGIAAIEVTLNTPDAFAAIQKLDRTFGNDILPGAGTVLSPEQGIQAIQAGAKYIISPVFKPELVQAVQNHDCPVIPGCLTPTEMQLAHEAGSDAIKLFPAESFGLSYMKSVLAPLDHLKIMPTGGISASNSGAWIQAGAFCLGVGSAILDKQAIASGQFEILTEKTRFLKSAIDEARANPV